MGPGEDLEGSSEWSKGLTIPKLRLDGSNWATYSDRVINFITSKGLKRYLLGTMWKPKKLSEVDGQFFLPGKNTLLMEEQIEKHKEEIDNYETKQASVREVIIYRTVDNSTYLQIKNELDVASMWKRVILIHAPCSRPACLPNYKTVVTWVEMTTSSLTYRN